jgi:hypothetical protein
MLLIFCYWLKGGEHFIFEDQIDWYMGSGPSAPMHLGLFNRPFVPFENQKSTLYARQEILGCLTHWHGSLSSKSEYLHTTRNISKWKAFSTRNKTSSVSIKQQLGVFLQLCCRGKATSVAYSEWVFVASDIQHETLMCHVAICVLSGCKIFSTFSHKRSDFIKMECKICVSIFSISFSFKSSHSK